MEKEMKNAVTLQSAKILGRQISKDLTAGGIFPKAYEDNHDPDVEVFKRKYAGWWNVARAILTMTKVFTGDKADAVIDKLIALGDELGSELESTL